MRRGERERERGEGVNEDDRDMINLYYYICMDQVH